MQERDLIERDIGAYLAKYQEKELLRFVSVGSVDDGKSTLIGRLLHDTNMVYEDQLQAVRAASALPDGELDLSLLTDGLTAEREQGITIDVAYRYFSTETRKFIIADTPGHVQYTRNMVTGASTADVAVILVDARLGVLQQSRRHAYIASLLGIPHLLVAINKMDLVGYSEKAFREIEAVFREFGRTLRFKDITFIPISALKGVNVVKNSDKTPWYEGRTVLDYLESVPTADDLNLENFRYPVQYVIRPNLNYRGFAGQVASGRVRTGDEVLVLPSAKRSRIKAIDTFDGELDSAFAPMSICVRLEHEIDISRGDMLVHPHDLPRVGRTFDVHLVWMSERPLDRDKTYIIKHTTQSIRMQIDAIHGKIDMDTLKEVDGSNFGLNDIGRATITCHRPLYYDPYTLNRATGAFVLIDSLTNNTVAAGMIAEPPRTQRLDEALSEIRAGSGLTPKTQVSPRERVERLGQQGATVWLTGLPGSGRWSLAYALERKLFDLGRTATVVDPSDEDLRSMISAAKAGTDAGLITICAFPSYKQADRDEVRRRIGPERFIQVYVNTSEALCRERRPDAIFDGFETPQNVAVTVELDKIRVEKAVDLILAALEARGQFTHL